MDGASTSLAGARVSAGGGSSSSGAGAWRSAGGGRSAALHPELRSRLQKLGIAIPGLRAGGGSPGPAVAAAAASAAPAERGASVTAAAAAAPSASAAAAETCEGEAATAAPQSPSAAPVEGSVVSRGEEPPVVDAETEDSPPAAGDAPQAGGLPTDPSLDELLLQLGDLDARSRALQKQGESLLRQGSTSEPPRRGPGGGGREQRGQDRKDEAPAAAGGAAAARRSEGTGTSAASAAGGAGAEATEEASAAKAIARNHPLQGLPLQQQRGDDFQRARQRRNERPPVAPATPGSNSARCGGKRCRKTFVATSPSGAGGSPTPPDSPSSARGPRTSCVALPPLKPSSSAPGRLNGESSWVPRRR